MGPNKNVVKRHKVLRFVPICNGKPITNVWRIWVQNNEFYAATRNEAQLAKFSFHSSFKWQFNSGSMNVRFVKPNRIFDHWYPVVTLIFTVPLDALPPLKQNLDKAVLLELPRDHRLEVTLMLSSIPNPPPLPPEFNSGFRMANFKLASGQRLIVSAYVNPFLPEDYEVIKQNGKSIRINYAPNPVPSETYAEVMLFYNLPEGNFLRIIPTGREAFHFEP
jgi:hypothetical protein